MGENEVAVYAREGHILTLLIREEYVSSRVRLRVFIDVESRVATRGPSMAVLKLYHEDLSRKVLMSIKNDSLQDRSTPSKRQKYQGPRERQTSRQDRGGQGDLSTP